MLRAINAHDRTLQVHFVDAPERFAAFKEGWLTLETVSEHPGFFQSYAWSGHVASVLSRALAGTYQPLVAIGVRDGVVAAVWPLSRQKQSGIWYLRSLDDPFGQFSNVLAIDDASADEIVAVTLAHVRNQRLADVMRFDRVFAGSPLHAALIKHGASVRGEVGAPVVSVGDWPSMEALKASRNKKTMKNLRNANNRLAKAGAHEHRVAVGDQNVTAIVEQTLRRRTAWLDAKGMTAPQFRSVAHHDVLTGGGAWGLDRQRAGFELICDGRPIAHQWGFVHANRYYAYMSATDPAAVLLSPGRLHLAFVIGDAMRIGVKAVELMTPASDYKMVWTDSVRPLCDMAMSLSGKGRIHDLLWEKTVRPVIKAIFYALPAGIRRRAVANDAGDEVHDA